MGAGVSRECGFPLSAELNNLVWHSIDLSDRAREKLASATGETNSSAKQIIGDDPIRVALGFAILRSDERARRAFQEGFAALDRERGSQPSAAHEAIAQLLHRGAIKIVISLNWDSKLEVAYRRKYGNALAARGTVLHKPHGDAIQPELPWILPGESGSLPAGLLDQVQELASDYPRVLIVIGYGEGDDEVIRRLITPAEEKWRVIRIGPEVTGRDDIRAKADEALSELISAIYGRPELEGWEYVNFDVQHGLADALLGRRLGPSHVISCPQLPEVTAIYRALSVSDLAVVGARSGSGKSISIYQAAYQFHRAGWEAIRAAFGDLPPERVIDNLSAVRHPTVAIADESDHQSIISRKEP